MQPEGCPLDDGSTIATAMIPDAGLAPTATPTSPLIHTRTLTALIVRQLQRPGVSATARLQDSR